MKQSNKRPTARKREPFFMLSIMAAIVAGLLLLDAAVPLLPRAAITSLFTGGKVENTAPNGEEVTRPMSLWEELFGRYEPNSDGPLWELPEDSDRPNQPDETKDWWWYETSAPIEDDPWVWETEAPIENWPDIDNSIAISYIDRSTVKEWQGQIAQALNIIKRQYEGQGIDILLLGLFDFGLDGTPEIVVTTYSDPNEAYPSYIMIAYDLDGMPLFSFGGGANMPQLWVYAQIGQTYPCITAYFHSYKTNEDGYAYSEEQMLQVLDDGGKMSVLYGVTRVGEEYIYIQNDRLTDKDGWYEAMRAFEKQYEALGETEMLWFGWPFDMNASEIARQMVTSEQRFVMPVLEAELYSSTWYPVDENA